MTVAVPALTPVTTPLDETIATASLVDVHVAYLRRSEVRPLDHVASAEASWVLSPSVIPRVAGMTREDRFGKVHAVSDATLNPDCREPGCTPMSASRLTVACLAVADSPVAPRRCRSLSAQPHWLVPKLTTRLVPRLKATMQWKAVLSVVV